MSVFVFGSVAAMAVAVAWALYGDQIAAAFAGSGKRRKQSPAELLADNQRLKRELAEAKQPTPCENCGHLADGVMPTDAEIAYSDRTDPAPRMAASWTGNTVQFAETARDTTLAAMALPGEEEMAAFLEAERAKNAAPRTETEADTVTLPTVVTVKPLHEAQADLEALVHATPPPAGASATEVSAITGALSSFKVHATVCGLEEAS